MHMCKRYVIDISQDGYEYFSMLFIPILCLDAKIYQSAKGAENTETKK